MTTTTRQVVIASVTDAPLDVDAHLRAVDDARQGAVALFVGRVRDHDPEVAGEVVRLTYTAHPSAHELIGEVTRRVLAERDPEGQARVAVTHRVGELAVGDAAIVAAVSGPHRALAFELCEGLVDELKRDLPVWKQQHAADGSAVWSGLT